MRRVKVSPKGQVVIPKPLRDKFGIREGEDVLVEEGKRGIFVMKESQDPLRAMVGLFEGKLTKPSASLVREIREESETRIKRVTKGHK